MNSVLNISHERTLMKNKSCEERKKKRKKKRKEKKEKRKKERVNRGTDSEIKVRAVCQRATGSHSWVDCT